MAPPRKKKPDPSSGQPANQSNASKPVPPVRTKLQPKDATSGENNPFDDVVLRSTSAVKPTSASTNPFGSDDEFDDSVSTLSSDNPFNDSDYDSEIADANRRKSVKNENNTFFAFNSNENCFISEA